MSTDPDLSPKNPGESIHHKGKRNTYKTKRNTHTADTLHRPQSVIIKTRQRTLTGAKWAANNHCKQGCVTGSFGEEQGHRRGFNNLDHPMLTQAPNRWPAWCELSRINNAEVHQAGILVGKEPAFN
ncbi:hypothetical protein [Pseudomonas sp.]|uniref:hypothetical protein n=1 Tax=Pseudomonas sp. TaxID=306 RepID=UPI0025EABAB8|nr:hypothetical protein [Pseudomonas sp.]